MTRRRIDAELVRRGLARVARAGRTSCVAAGRVSVGGAVASKAGDPGRADGEPAWSRTSTRRPTYVSRGAHKLLGALDAFGARRSDGAGAPWTPARRPAASPTCCCARGAAHVVARRRRLRPAGLGAAHRRAGRPCSSGPTCATSTAGAGRRAGRPGGRGPVVHLAGAWCSPALRRVRRRRRPTWC